MIVLKLKMREKYDQILNSFSINEYLIRNIDVTDIQDDIQ